MPEISIITNNLGRAMPLALLILCLTSSWLLFAAPRRNSARNILATFLLMLGLSYVPGCISFASGRIMLHDSLELNPFVLGATNIFIALLCLYPVEVIRPGWLTASRILRIIAPALAVNVIYFGISLLIPERFTPLDSFSAFIEEIGHFNVWGRLLLIISALSYLGGSIYFYTKYSKPYMEWCENNFSSFEGLSISWIAHFTVVICFISLLFLISIFTASRLWLLIFDMALLIGIPTLTFRGIFQTEAYPEDFFRSTLDEHRARTDSSREEQRRLESARLGSAPGAGINSADISGNPHSRNINERSHTPDIDDREPAFDENIPRFAEQIKAWFDTDKPYLDVGFQLSDVGQKIPVCRTYLSRIFNEGFGDSFSRIVRAHRLGYAAELLISEPEMSIAAIAMESGFSTPAAFNRAFSSAHNGQTPGQYRKANLPHPEGNL